jgi:hypothetical protein
MYNSCKLLSLILITFNLFCSDAVTSLDKITVEYIDTTGGSKRKIEVRKDEIYQSVIRRLLNVPVNIASGIDVTMRYGAIPPRTAGKPYTDWVAVDEETKIVGHNTKERFFEGDGKVTDKILAHLQAADHLVVSVFYKPHAAVSGEKRPE